MHWYSYKTEELNAYFDRSILLNVMSNEHMLCIEFHEQQNQGKCKNINIRSRKKGTVEPKSQKKVRQPNAVYSMNMRMIAYTYVLVVYI